MYFFYILQQLCMYVFTNTKLHIEYYYHPTLAHQQTSTLKKGPAGNLSSLSAFAIIVVGPWKYRQKMLEGMQVMLSKENR